MFRYQCKNCRRYKYTSQANYILCEQCGSTNIRKDLIQQNTASKRKGCGCNKRR